MTTTRLNRRQIATLSQLLTASNHRTIEALLGDALGWLVGFWPAEAGTLLYVAPGGEQLTLTHQHLAPPALALVEQCRSAFRRAMSGEPAVGCYPIDDQHDLLELTLQNGTEAVGLLHLVVGCAAAKEEESDEDLLLLLVRAIGAEADKLSLLHRAEHDLRELNLLYGVGQLLAGNLDLDDLLRSIQRSTPEVMGAARCTIMLYDEQTGELTFEARHADGTTYTVGFPSDRGIAGWVFTNGEAQIVNDVEQDERFYGAVQRQTDFLTHSLICTPLKTHRRTVGVMQVLNKISGEPFSAQDLRLLTTLASQAAVAIENASLYRRLKEERDRLLTKEEEVRHLIARELHDGPTQSVAAIAMNIEFTKRLLQLMPEKVPGELDNLLELARKTSHDIRTLLFELRPLVLETQGLRGAIEQYVTRFRDPEGIRLRLDAPGDLPPLSREVEAAAFMILQEAVNNARKHAGAVEVVIGFRGEGDWLVATVRDRGRGFDMETIQSTYSTRGSLGLLNMHERARLIGAEFAMRSAIGQGTEVELRIPLP